MRIWLLALILFYCSNLWSKRVARTIDIQGGALNSRWVELYQSDDLNIRSLLDTLQKSPIGKKLIMKAKSKANEFGETLLDLIRPGSGSLTDTTLIRRFSVDNADKITYETKSKVYINKNLSRYDAILDLAHELTHFVYRTNFNPYQLNFTLDQFIQNTIEGGGGEVEAFLTECRVLNELFPSRLNTHPNCYQIIDTSTGKLSFQKAVEKFYQVGAYYELFKNKLQKHKIEDLFPQVSKNKASFVSSAYGMPYPMAAYQEYSSVLKKVCDNDKKRLVYLMKESAGRSPASIVKKVENDYFSRCSDLDKYQ